MFSKQLLTCCICSVKYEATVDDSWHKFGQGVCGQRCFYEKEWRRTLSILNRPYRPDPRQYDERGYPVKTTS